jgi:short-subunit dehydrogenase
MIAPRRAGTVLILGATSLIARAAGKILAKSYGHMILAARDEEEAIRCAADVEIREGCTTSIVRLLDSFVEDASDFAGMVRSAVRGELLLVLVCIGYLGDEALAAEAPGERNRIIRSNFLVPVSLVESLLPILCEQGAGMVAVLSSVAGDRIRKSNATYGTAKAALNAYLTGLHGRLVSTGVRVTTLKLGPVDTSMTFGMRRIPLMISPEAAAGKIAEAVSKGSRSCYIPKVWRLIMWVLRALPEPLFIRLKL